MVVYMCLLFMCVRPLGAHRRSVDVCARAPIFHSRCRLPFPSPSPCVIPALPVSGVLVRLRRTPSVCRRRRLYVYCIAPAPCLQHVIDLVTLLSAPVFLWKAQQAHGAAAAAGAGGTRARGAVAAAAGRGDGHAAVAVRVATLARADAAAAVAVAGVAGAAAEVAVDVPQVRRTDRKFPCGACTSRCADTVVWIRPTRQQRREERDRAVAGQQHAALLNVGAQDMVAARAAHGGAALAAPAPSAPAGHLPHALLAAAGVPLALPLPRVSIVAAPQAQQAPEPLLPPAPPPPPPMPPAPPPRPLFVRPVGAGALLAAHAAAALAPAAEQPVAAGAVDDALGGGVAPVPREVVGGADVENGGGGGVLPGTSPCLRVC